MSLLVVGSIAFDSVKTPFGEVEEVLGGSATYFSVSASYFTDVCMVAVVGEDFPDKNIELLKSRSIDVEGIERRKGKTFRWRGRYGYDLNEAHTLDTELNVFADFLPDIPERYRDCEYVFLANIDPELQMEVLSQVKNPKLVACDTMNFWIEGKMEALKETLSMVNILIINDAEARELGGEANIVTAAKKILSFGPETLVIKRGEYGSLMFTDSSIFSAPAYPLEYVYDPTGAGDSFAGGFMGYIANIDNVTEETKRQGVIFGSTMASFNVEDFSLNRLKGLKGREIEERFKFFKKLSHFEDISTV
ncbi:MAG: PfkB family carbohydrate kinase [Nitrospinota bacterium]